MRVPKKKLERKALRRLPRKRRERRPCGLVRLLEQNPAVVLSRELIILEHVWPCWLPSCLACEKYRLSHVVDAIEKVREDWRFDFRCYTVVLEVCSAKDFDKQRLHKSVQKMHQLATTTLGLDGVAGVASALEVASGKRIQSRESLIVHVNLVVATIRKFPRRNIDPILRRFGDPRLRTPLFELNPPSAYLWYFFKGVRGETREQLKKRLKEGPKWSPATRERIEKIIDDYFSTPNTLHLHSTYGIFDGHTRRSANRAVRELYVAHETMKATIKLGQRDISKWMQASRHRASVLKADNRGRGNLANVEWLLDHVGPKLLARLDLSPPSACKTSQAPRRLARRKPVQNASVGVQPPKRIAKRAASKPVAPSTSSCISKPESVRRAPLPATKPEIRRVDGLSIGKSVLPKGASVDFKVTSTRRASVQQLNNSTGGSR